MRHRINSTSRRGFLAVAAATTMTSLIASAQPSDATPAESGSGRVGAPDWGIEIHQVRDPHPEPLQVPAALPPGMRVVSIEVEVTNDSGQALNFTPVDIRLRDAGGMEYRGGAAIGSEPMINPRNLNPGERSRGWVWFVIPEMADLVEVIYVAPQPQFRHVL